MFSEKLGPEWKPDRAKFVLMVTPTGHLAACIDPGFPSAWRQSPYYEILRRWACERAESQSSSWPGVDVWIGQRCIIILPDGEKDLGIVAPDEEVRIDCMMTVTGPVYVAQKFRVPDTGPPAELNAVLTNDIQDLPAVSTVKSSRSRPRELVSAMGR